MLRLTINTFVLLVFLSTALNAQASLNIKKMAVTDENSTIDNYNDIWGYQHGNKEYAVLGKRSAIQIFDVTECGNPTLEHEWIDGPNTIWRDFKDYGDYIYGVCDIQCNEGLQIINKNTWEHWQYTNVFTKAHNIFIDKAKGKLYACGTNTAFNGLHVFDLKSNPTNPVLLASVNFQNVINSTEQLYTHDLYVQNDTAYCSMENEYLIWDMRDLDNIALIGEIEEGVEGYVHSSWKHPEHPYAYGAEETHGKPIRVYNLEDITEPYIESSFKDPLIDTLTNVIAHNPFVYLNRLYISYYHDGIKIYDVKDPAVPNLMGYYDTFTGNTNYNGFDGAWGIYPFLPSGCILAADITYGMYTFKSTVIPEARVRLTNQDIVIDDDSKGVIFSTPDDLYYKMTVDNSGNPTFSSIPKPISGIAEIVNANIQFDLANRGIILKNTLGSYFRLEIDSSGNLTTTSVGTIPPNSVIIPNENIFFTQYRAGLISKNIDGSCTHFTLGDLGVSEITTINCE